MKNIGFPSEGQYLEHITQSNKNYGEWNHYSGGHTTIGNTYILETGILFDTPFARSEMKCKMKDMFKSEHAYKI